MFYDYFNKFLNFKLASTSDCKLEQQEEDDFTRNHARNTSVHSDVVPSKSEVQRRHEEAIASSKDRIVAYMIEEGVPGLAICVALKNKVVWHSAFGFCDVENRLQCKPEARMRIASISKPVFVSTVIAPMIEQGEIDLNSSIYDYITPDEFPKKKYGAKDVDISVEQLITHTSGIRHYNEGKGTDLPFRSIGSAKSQRICQCDDQYERKGFFTRTTYRNVIDALEPFKNDPLVNEPGKYNYSTYGYTLLSAVAERAHQRAATDDETKKEQIEDFWLRTLRRDWGLSDTSLDQDEVLLPNRARYYLRTGYNGKLINAPYADNSVKWAGGGLNSTTKDLVKFGSALIDCYKERVGAKLRRETLELLWKERSNCYGLGFKIQRLDPNESGGEKRAIYHLGGALGASSALIIYPESEIVVAILTNMGASNPGKIGFQVADQFTR